METNGSDIAFGCMAIIRIYYTLYVTLILYDTSYKHIYEVCPNSTLWMYVAISMIIPFLTIWFRSRNNLGLIRELAVMCYVYLFMAIWGGILVLPKTCTHHHFHTTQLFYIALYNIATNILGCILTLVFIATTNIPIIDENEENQDESGGLLEHQMEL